MRWLILSLAILACFHGVRATQVAAPYSNLVHYATQAGKTNYEHAVYVWPWVNAPGAYPFKKGMTVANLIAAAGGLTKDERQTPPWVVHTINVFRPSPEDPNPVGAICCFSVAWTNSESNVSDCTFELQKGDFVSVGMGTCVTNRAGDRQPALIQKSETLEQRVLRGDEYAFLEVADRGRKDLMPTLEKFAHDETAARMALAKLGVKKYLDEFVTDLTSTNSPLLKSWEEAYRGPSKLTEDAKREAELTAKGKAIDRLVYIGNKSTVKYIAAELYNTNCPNRGNSDSLLMSRTPIAWLAARALSQMHLENAPRPSDEGDPEWLNYIEAWKKWWKLNKDKYP